MGWVLTLRGGAKFSDRPAHQIPWFWTYALVLEKRWEQIAELSAWDEEDIGVPKEYWHDAKRVQEWVDEQKRKRKDKMNQ